MILQTVALYQNLTRLTKSQLRGEGQFGIGEAEAMAAVARGNKEQTMSAPFRHTRRCLTNIPKAGAWAMRWPRWQTSITKKVTRAVDVFEKVLSDYPDGNFLDVILFNYGPTCSAWIARPRRSQFDQLIDEFPSQLAPEAKRISQALAKAGF